MRSSDGVIRFRPGGAPHRIVLTYHIEDQTDEGFNSVIAAKILVRVTSLGDAVMGLTGGNFDLTLRMGPGGFFDSCGVAVDSVMEMAGTPGDYLIRGVPSGPDWCVWHTGGMNDLDGGHYVFSLAVLNDYPGGNEVGSTLVELVIPKTV